MLITHGYFMRRSYRHLPNAKPTCTCLNTNANNRYPPQLHPLQLQPCYGTIRVQDACCGLNAVTLPSISAFILIRLVAVPFLVATGLCIEKVGFRINLLARAEIVDAEHHRVATTLHKTNLFLL